MLLDQLADIGRNPTTGGYDRFSWTAVDLATREWFFDRADGLGLQTETDRNGNLWAWWGAQLPGSAFVCGSHLDSVPSGGAWDGPLGVAAAFAAVEQLQSQSVTPVRPVAIVSFTEEEGSRFGVACLGSRLLTGAIDPDRARSLRDNDAITLADAMTSAGHDPAALGADPERMSRIGEFIELHIEQGHLPVSGSQHAGLPDTGHPIGLATQIWPHGRWRLDFRGTANHAGTTPLRDRNDPVIDLARAVLEVRAAAEELGVLGTVGKLEVVPGAVNAIAATASIWVDARGEDAEAVRALVSLVESRLGTSAIEESWTAVTPFAPELSAALNETLGGDIPLLPSGAGHDAGVLSLSQVPVAMLFVRNPTGVSHSPEERIDEADALLGVTALVAVIRARAT